MKKANKLLSILLAIIMCLGILPMAVSAAAPIASGNFGEYGSGSWVISADGKLTILGEVGLSGEWKGAPWYDYGESIKRVSFASDSYAATDASLCNMFLGCVNLTSIDFANFDTSSVTDMSYMFGDCWSLTELNLSGFDTSSVTDMSYMFYDCYSLTELDLSCFDTSSVKTMLAMFLMENETSSALASLDLSSFDTSSVVDMGYMFFNCASLTELDLSSFDTSSVESMEAMFYLCSSLGSLDLSNFDTSSVVSMDCMFSYCSSLTYLDLSSFDTSFVTEMGYMFDKCGKAVSGKPAVGWARTADDAARFNDATETEIVDSKLVFEVNALENIAVTAQPNKKAYFEGEAFDPTGMVVQANYSNGTSKEITNYTVTDGDSFTPGQTAVTISYAENGVTKTATVGIFEKKFTSIEIKSAPSNREWKYKTDVSRDGLKVVAKYNDGEEVDVTDLVEIDNYKASNKRGDHIATVKYEGMTATFNYSVKYTFFQWIIKILLFGFIWY